MTHWKTTALGILTILVAVLSAALTWLKTGALPDIATLTGIGSALTSGVGLIFAKDAKTTALPDATPAAKASIILLAAFGLAGASLCMVTACSSIADAAKKADAVAGQPLIKTVSTFGAQVLGQEAAVIAVKNIQPGVVTAKVGSAAAEVLYQALTPTGEQVDGPTVAALVQQSAVDYGLSPPEATQVSILVSSLLSQIQPLEITYPNLAGITKEFVYGVELRLNAGA